MQNESKAKPNGWSEIVRGVSGRLIVAFEDLNPGLRHAIYLELANSGFDPVAVSNQPKIDTELFDSHGKPLATSSQVGDGPRPIQQWAVITREAYIGFRVDMQSLGVPTREHGVVLLAIGGKAWELRPGKYTLKASAVFDADADGPADHWAGELELPEVEVVVTPEMLAVK
jgi:hypothetical protein